MALPKASRKPKGTPSLTTTQMKEFYERSGSGFRRLSSSSSVPALAIVPESYSEPMDELSAGETSSVVEHEEAAAAEAPRTSPPPIPRRSRG
jgi:hypothetical protein